jgi:hypothetical protein
MTTIAKWNSCFDSKNSQVQFNPSTNISNCYAWWKSDSGVTLSGSSTTVSQWTDSIGGRTLVSSSAATAPTFQIDSQNNRAAIVFDGTNDSLTNLDSKDTWNFLHQTGSIVACFKSVSSQSLQVVWSTSGFTGTTGMNFAVSWTTSTAYYFTLAVSASSPQIRQYEQTTYPGLNNICWYAQAINTTTLATKGSNKTYGTNSHGLSTLSGTATYNFALANIAGGSCFKGSIYEVILFNKVLSETEMAQIGMYFNQKYGAIA